MIVKKIEIETSIIELKVKLQDAHSKWWPENKAGKVLAKTYYGYKKQLAELSAVINIIDHKLMKLRIQQGASKSPSFEKAFIEVAKELLTGRVFASIVAAANARIDKPSLQTDGGSAS